MRLSLDLELIGHKFSIDVQENPASRLIHRMITKTEYFPRAEPDASKPAKNLVRFARAHREKDVRVEWCQSLDTSLSILARNREMIGNDVIFRSPSWKVTLEKRDGRKETP
jgi:hypothetical protein